ncbi:MAG: hypothetical protein KAR19_17640 [Bacteroidales bacterium]|nr:hypothetical protein [Bacteroidales bacterium]
MKLIKSTIFFTFVALSVFSCNSQTSADSKTTYLGNADIQIFYFHNTNRCATCNAVENETKMVLETFYADKMKKGAIDFTSLNLEEEDGKKVAKSLQVSGQALLIVKGETRVNLTNEGFMNARTNPDKFHDILKTQIDKLL